MWTATVLATLGFGAAQTAGPGVNVFRPDRGFRPTGSYAISETETVNETNGNVSIRIPLAQTPPARNGSNFRLELLYNSALYNLATQDLDRAQYIVSGYSGQDQTVTVNALRPSDLSVGGWRYSHRYYLEQDVRPCSTDEPACFKLNLILPDGSSHLLRLKVTTDAYNDPAGTGFSQYNLDGRHSLDSSNIGPNLVYYTTDGTYIRVEITTSLDGSSPPKYNGVWRASFPDGTYVSGPITESDPKEADQICDRNDNCIHVINTYAPGLLATELVDALDRRVVITYNATPDVDEIKALGYGAEVGTSGDPRQNPTSVTTRVHWKQSSFGAYANSGATRLVTYKCLTPDNIEYVCTHTFALRVVEKVTLPHASGSLTYDFVYADSSAPDGEHSQAEIRQITLPSARTSDPQRASVYYKWTRIAQAVPFVPTDWFDAFVNPVRSKKLSYVEEDGAIATIQTREWTYNILGEQSSITDPDGRVTTHEYGNRTLVGSWDKGLVYKTTVSPLGETTWRVLEPEPAVARRQRHGRSAQSVRAGAIPQAARRFEPDCRQYFRL